MVKGVMSLSCLQYTKMKIKLDHYSKEKRSSVDPEFMGTAHAGEEKKRVKVPRSYWYRHGTKPEHFLNHSVKHTGEGALDLYDVSDDRDGLVEGLDPSVWEENLVVAGYDGYFNSLFYPEIIAVFKKIDL